MTDSKTQFTKDRISFYTIPTWFYFTHSYININSSKLKTRLKDKSEVFPLFSWHFLDKVNLSNTNWLYLLALPVIYRCLDKNVYVFVGKIEKFKMAPCWKWHAIMYDKAYMIKSPNISGWYLQYSRRQEGSCHPLLSDLETRRYARDVTMLYFGQCVLNIRSTFTIYDYM